MLVPTSINLASSYRHYYLGRHYYQIFGIFPTGTTIQGGTSIRDRRVSVLNPNPESSSSSSRSIKPVASGVEDVVLTSRLKANGIQKVVYRTHFFQNLCGFFSFFIISIFRFWNKSSSNLRQKSRGETFLHLIDLAHQQSHIYSL